MSNCEPARFHSAGSKRCFIDSASNRSPCVHAFFAYSAHSSIERRMRSDIKSDWREESPEGGGSPRNAKGGGLPSAHVWKRLFWFSFQNLSQSLPGSKGFIDGRPLIRETISNDCSLPLGGGLGGGALECHDLTHRLAIVQEVEP